MEKKTNNFKQFLENYYSDTFTDPTGKEGKNSVFKVNNCIMDNIQMPANQIITLPSGCYSKMLTSDSLDVYSTCLQQFSLNEEQILNIQKCVKQSPVVGCVNGVNFEITKEGDVEYTNCCGLNTVLTLGVGQQTINDCLQIDSLKSYSKNESPATITLIEYVRLKCLCEKQ
jgi:hypothetical protein